MKQWTFGKQIGIGILLLFASGALTAVLHNSVFLNLAWILYGLLFVIHPVCPEQAKFRYSEEGAQKIARMAGLACILIGLNTRFELQQL